MYFHRLLVAAALCAVFAGVAMAQVSSTRVSDFDWRCESDAGAKISDHQRFDTAFVACLNAPHGTYVQGGRYRVASVVLTTASTTATDAVPEPFTFTDQSDVATSSTITSAAVTITGIATSITCSATGGTIDLNSGGSFASSQSVANNDTIRARHTSSASNSTATNTVVDCNGVSDTFTSTTTAGGESGVFFNPDIGALANGNTLVSSGTFNDENNALGGDAVVQSAVTRPGGQTKAIEISYTQDESQSTLVIYGTTADPVGPMPATATLFVRSYEMVDAGWAGHWPQGLKTLRVYAGDQGTGCQDAPNDIPYISEKIIYPGYDTSPDPRLEDYVTSGSWAYCNAPAEIEANYTAGMLFDGSQPYLRTGVWYKWERWYQMNSGNDVADGVMQIWINDILVLNRTDVVYRSVSRGTGGAGGTTWKSMWFGGNYSNTGTFTATPPIRRYIDSPYASTTLDR